MNTFCFLYTCAHHLHVFRYLDVNEIKTIDTERLKHLKALKKL